MTPATTATNTTPIDYTALNMMGKPGVRVDAGSITQRELVGSEVQAAAGIGAYNYLDNGNFQENRWTRGSTVISCPTGVQTFRADQWFVQPAGAAVTYQQASPGPDSNSLYTAQITGASSVTTVAFGQNILASLSTVLQNTLILTFWMYNSTGSAITPTVLLNACNSFESWTSVTNLISQAVSSAGPNGQWTFYTVALNATGMTTLANGGQLIIQLPSGALASGSASVQFSRLKLEVTSNAVGSAFIPQKEIPDTYTNTVNAPYNLLGNGQLDRFLYPGGTYVGPYATAGVDCYNAEEWFVNAAGASTGTITAAVDAPNSLTSQCMRYTGGTGVGIVDIGQNLSPSRAGKLQRNMVLSVWVKYVDGVAGASTTPALKLQTPSTPNGFSSVSTVLSATLSPCASGTWTKQTYQFSAAGYSNLANGLRIVLEFASGALSASSQYVQIAQALLEEGTTASTFKPYLEHFMNGLPGAVNLVVNANQGGGLISISMDEICFRSSTGALVNVMAPTSYYVATNTTGANGIDTGVVANNTWYQLGAIWNGTTVGGLLTVAGNTPLLPTGYPYYCLLGYIRVNGSGAIVSGIQYGRKWFYTSAAMTGAPQIFSGTLPTSYTSQSLSAIVPPAAKTVFGWAGETTSVALLLQIADASTPVWQTQLSAATTGSALNSMYNCLPFEQVMSTPQVIYIKAAAANAALILAAGYTF